MITSILKTLVVFCLPNPCNARSILIALCLISPTSLWATDYFVQTPANGGSDANDGLSWATAKATIQAAITLSSAGDRVHVSAGTFNENITFPSQSNFQLLGGFPVGGGVQDPWNNTTVIDGTGLGGSIVSIPKSTVGFSQFSFSDLVFDGFTVQGLSTNNAALSAIKSESADLTIRRSIIQNNANSAAFSRAGIDVLSPISDIFTVTLKIEETIVRNNTGGGVGGIFVDPIGTPTVEVTNCEVTGNHATNTSGLSAGGIAIGAGGQNIASADITNCTIADNTSAHSSIPVGGVYMGLVNDFHFTVDIKNSILWNSQDDIYQEPDPFVTARVTYSDVRDTGDTGTGVIHSDPLFVGGSDYRLSAGSPAINSGTSSGAPSADLLGIARPFGAGFDMGVYEYDVLDAPPEVDNPIADVTVDEDAQNIVIDLSSVFSDPESDPIVKTLNGNTNPGLVNAVVSGNSLTLDFQDNQNGIALITVRATANGLTVDDTFQVQVNAQDDPPQLDNPIADINELEDAPDITINLLTVFSDIDSALSFSVPNNSNPQLIQTDVSESTLTLELQPNESGNSTITVRALGDSVAVENSFTVNVSAVDDPPEVTNPIADFSVDEDDPSTTIDLSTVFQDVDSTPVTFSILSNTNSGVVATNLVANELQLIFLPDQSGNADITIRATAGGQFTDDVFTVSVNPINDPPVFTTDSNLAFLHGETEIRQITASDAENDPVTFMLTDGDDQALFSITLTGELSFLAPPDIKDPLDFNQDNIYEVEVQAFDGSDTTHRLFFVSPDSGCTFYTIALAAGTFVSICI
ncbi:MAG: choice-of-anchor Q domain-containing protein [Pseudomonadota bacterium]